MIANLYHRIIHHPQPEDAGTITITAMVEGYNSTFTASSLLEDFNEEECHSQEELNYFLIESGLNDCDTTDGIIDLIIYVGELTCSATSNYSPECALQVWLSLVSHDHQTDEADQVPFEEDDEIEEAVQVSFEESYDIPFRPACTLVVESLPRKLYEKTSSTDETCTICLEKFNNGARVATLPCQHYFDNECVVKWFETSHFCPLCRFELPCEDQ